MREDTSPIHRPMQSGRHSTAGEVATVQRFEVEESPGHSTDRSIR